MRGLHWPEIVVILLVVLLIFGAARLPKMGASLGRSMRAFKGALTGQEEISLDEEPEVKPKRKRAKSAAKN